jgi:dTDP-4-dehydrorhamnose 3,5-epimerase
VIFQETPIAGSFLLDLELIEDERGFFAQAWQRDEAAAHGIEDDFNRANISFNRKKGTVRGLHAQKGDASEIKLVQCIRGRIFDVLVDIRPESATFGQWFGAELTADNHRMLYIPQGCLHGFQTLEDNAEVFYRVIGNYQPALEIGARYDDPMFGIVWPTVEERILSVKDENWPRFSL